MLNWAKKHVRHKYKDAPDERGSSETEASPERKESSGRKSKSPEKKLGSEKRTPSFARRFASIRKLASERKSPEKGSRGKSKSPEKGLRAESLSPGTTRRPDHSTDETEPLHQESCIITESSSSEMQPESSPDHRVTTNGQSLEDREASPSPTLSPAVCLSEERQPLLGQRPDEEADHAQASQQTKDSESAGDSGLDRVRETADTPAVKGNCVTHDQNESPQSHHSPGIEPKGDQPLGEPGSRNLRDLVIRESDEYEKLDRRERPDDSELVACKDDEISSKLNAENIDSACQSEAGVGEPTDGTSLQNVDNDTSIETNGVHETTTADTEAKRRSQDLKIEVQMIADGQELHQSTTDHKDAVPNMSVTAVTCIENGLSSDIMYIDGEYSDNYCSSSYVLQDKGNMDQETVVEEDNPLMDKNDLPSDEIIRDTEEPPFPVSVSPKDIEDVPSLITDVPKNSEEPPVAGSDTDVSKMDSRGQVADNTSETTSLVDLPKNTGELLPQSMGNPLENQEHKEEPTVSGSAREMKDSKVTDSECKNTSTSPKLSSKEFAPSPLSDTLKNGEASPPIPFSEPPDDETPPPIPLNEPPDDETPPPIPINEPPDDETPPIPLSEPPDDTDVPPTLPDSEPPQDCDEPPPLPVKDGVSITEKPPRPPKSDLLKCSLGKGDVERPLPISPFSAFDEKSKTTNVAGFSETLYDKEEKRQSVVSQSTSSSNRKLNDLGGSEPQALDSSHCKVDDKLQGSLPSSLSVSCEKDDAMELVPPCPTSQLSHGSDINDTELIISQPSMSTSYDGSHECTEHKALGPVSESSSPAAVGGSLPSSPSVPRRAHRPHPVPAARSLQTLSTATPTKRTVTKADKEEEIVKEIPRESPEPLREASGLNEHNEKIPREIPVPKPRKISLNPFESDEGEECEIQQIIPQKQVPVPKPRKIVSLNPFDSDDDESEIQLLEKSKAQTQSSGTNFAASAKLSTVGKNPFDEDEDEVEENSSHSAVNTTGELEFRPMRSSSPATHSLSSSQSSLSPRHLNDSLASISSQSSKFANESTSTNPFDEDDDESRGVHNGLVRETLSRKSFSVTSSSPLQRDVVRSSLPPGTRGRTGRKKRPAPLPPGFRPQAMSTSSRDQRLFPDIANSSREGSTSSITQETHRRDSVTSMSSLTLSPKKAPPPRPPPPKIKSNFMTK